MQLMDANPTAAASKECGIVFIEPGNYNLQELKAELKTEKGVAHEIGSIKHNTISVR